MTDSGNTEQSVKLIKALINPKYNARWAMETGYFPTTKASENCYEYQAYYNAIDYSNKSDVINKECAKLNQDVYMNHAEQWQFFIEESFIGSAVLREVVARRLLLNVFRDVSDVDSEQEYIREIKEILSNPEISTNPNISVDYADVF